MSKITDINHFKREKLTKKIENIKATDYNKLTYGYLLDLAESLEEGDIETLQYVCTKHSSEFILTINPEDSLAPYRASVHLDVGVENSSFELKVLYKDEFSLPEALFSLAKDLRLYYTYLIEIEE